VILADTNIWMALVLSRHIFHDEAQDWFAGHREAGVVLFCRSTQQSFLRLITTDAIAGRYGVPALDNRAAWELMEKLRGDRRVGWADEPREVETLWRKLAIRGSCSPKLWMDAYLAAFAIAGACTLATTDGAFEQFEGLDCVVLRKK